MFTERTPRVVAARQLVRRTGREKTGRFLAEGAPAVREALAWQGKVHEVFVTVKAAVAHPALVDTAVRAGIPVSTVSERAATVLSETVTPQGILAICSALDVPLSQALSGTPRLVAVLVGIADPGNAGTITRAADAAGADAVLFAGDTVDPHNGKCVRATTGSIFHLPIARSRDVHEVLAACRTAGLTLIGADSHAAADLDSADLSVPTAWVFGSESHGLPPDVPPALDRSLRVPIYGHAESLNLAAAAAVCLYASATAQRHSIA